MLAKNPLSRLCKLSQIRNNKWFAGFNWESLISLDIKVPHKPSIQHQEIDETNVIPYSGYVKVKF